jgi:hypothetical protein
MRLPRLGPNGLRATPPPFDALAETAEVAYVLFDFGDERTALCFGRQRGAAAPE